MQSNLLVIGASSLGTVFEWYDFTHGLLASVISRSSFPASTSYWPYICAGCVCRGFAVARSAPWFSTVWRSGRTQAHLSDHHASGGSIFAFGFAELATAGARACAVVGCACSNLRSWRVWRWRLTSWKFPENAGCSPVSFRPRPHWDRRRLIVVIVTHQPWGGCLQILGLAHSVLDLVILLGVSL